MSERSENSTTTSSGSEAAATNAKTSSLHATMLNFVLEQRLAERLQHSPIQVWTEFLNKYHQTTAELGPIAQSPIGLMEIFVQTVLPAAACKSADHKSKVAEHCYYCFLRLCLKNWRNSSDLALVKVQTNTSEIGLDPLIVATSRNNLNDHLLQQQLRTDLQSVDAADMILSFLVATNYERESAILIPPAELMERVVELRSDDDHIPTGHADLHAALQYCNKVHRDLCTNEQSHLATNATPEILTRTMFRVSFDVCLTHPDPLPPRVPVAPKSRSDSSIPNDLSTTQTPRASTAHWQRPPYALLNRKQIIDVLSKLPVDRQKRELRFLEKRAIKGTNSRADRIARNSMPVSPISGMLHFPSRRLGQRARSNSKRPELPQLGRKSPSSVHRIVPRRLV